MKIWIGWDPREAEAAEVCKWSIEKNSSISVNVEFLKLKGRGGVAERLGFDADELLARGGATQFSFSRFLVPLLEGGEGIALFMDCDMYVMGDVADLARIPMRHYALRCTQPDFEPTTDVKMDGQPQTAYKRKLWSSFMLLNCRALLPIWTLDAVLNETGAWLHQFKPIPDAAIGELDPRWNETASIRTGPPGGETLNFHWTEFPPWFDETRDRAPEADVWFWARDTMVEERLIHGNPSKPKPKGVLRRGN